MKSAFFCLVAFFLPITLIGQEFDILIAKTADTLSKKIVASGKKKVAITDFLNIDQSITQLGTFLSGEVSSELANLTENQTKFRILERANLDQIFKEKHLVNFSDPSGLAKELGKIDAADALIFATITDFDGYYRVVIKMLDTKNGDALSSYRVSFVKTPSLENLNKTVIKNKIPNNSSSANPAGNHELTVMNEATGTICFLNRSSGSRPPTSAKVEILNSTSILKTITVPSGETTCAYELNSGVYKVNIEWLSTSGWGNNVKEYREIKVISGKSATIPITF